ncbi:MAG TPA: hypothetical protein VF594_08110 [Rubricoccaceae bacterium]
MLRVAALLLVAVVPPVAAQETSPKAFEAYRTALLAEDGHAVVGLVDSGTLAYYGQGVEWALDADSADVAAMRLIDRLMVFSLRHRVPADTVRAFDGASSLSYAVRKGWIGAGSVQRLQIVRTEATGPTGFATFDERGQIRMGFTREEGRWKVDLTSMLPLANLAFHQVAVDAGQTDDEMLFQILGSLTTRQPDRRIWQPLGR